MSVTGPPAEAAVPEPEAAIAVTPAAEATPADVLADVLAGAGAATGAGTRPSPDADDAVLTGTGAGKSAGLPPAATCRARNASRVAAVSAVSSAARVLVSPNSCFTVTSSPSSLRTDSSNSASRALLAS
ncbi:hypothetical protein DSM19430T_03730 [Desulfovibrio psychrotolerans]|uniref:Uncharacterized protein n=1 Tax=Desulfovibrio psychrotolerans TaxID=415242 RepID=A0A7J0BPV7_9BACT|nr:hypothetical protein DSM19430T_03730 [Desulfovibrio psychrotolerans]